MKNFIKIFSLLMAMILFSANAFAAAENDVNKAEELREMMDSDLDYFDDVYRFDLSIEKENEDGNDEIISNPEAAFAVLTLGIMKPGTDGLFNENDLVSYSEFASMLYVLSSGPENGFDPGYSSYKDGQITVSEATYHVLNTLGYTMGRTYGSFNEMQLAQKLGLFKGGYHKGEALLTRGIAAQLFYNALETEILTQNIYGNDEEYTTGKDNTLLRNIFKVEKIEGTVNATTGINIYSTVLPKNNQIQIDRVVYDTGNLDFTDLLGKYVEGYMRIDINKDNPVILGLKKSSKDKSLTINLSDIYSIKEDYIRYYDGDKLRNISTNNLKYVLHNGETKLNYTFSQELIGGDGEIVFGGSRGGSYEFAIVREKSSFTVRYIAVENQKIFLNDGLLFNGKDYIDVSNEKGDRFIRIVKDGSIISIADIKSDNAISVIQRKDMLYTYIEVSDKSISGSINALNDGKIGIAAKEYPITKLYTEAANKPNATARNFVLGDSGTFYLTSSGIIAGYSGNDGVKYGYLTLVGSIKGMKSQLEIRMFTESNEWLTVQGAEKIELDGKKMEESDATDIIIEEEKNITYQPVRYKLNAKNELVFLDTMRQTEYSDNKKALTPDRMQNWSGTTNWTSPYVIYNGSESYSIFDAKFFIVPGEDNLENEDLYSVKTSTSIESNTTISLDMYNLDEMGHTPLVISQDTTSSTAGLYGSRTMAIEKVRHVIKEDGNDSLTITGYQTNSISPGVGNWGGVTLTISEQLLNREPDINFKPGDIILWAKDATGKELINYRLLVRDGQMYNGQSPTQFDSNTNITYAYGVANAFNFDASIKTIQVKVDQGDGTFGTYTFVPRGVQEWVSSEKSYKPIALDEISLGEKLLIVGQGCHTFITVFR